jgi:HK97 gp10 family phage protein
MTLEGFESTRRALVAAPERARVHASSAVAASTFAITQRSRSLVPIDTGRLKSAIGSSRVVSGLQGSVGITDREAFYWRFVEFGTRRMSARPFFRPAAEQERNVFIQRMRDIGPSLERDLSTGRFL